MKFIAIPLLLIPSLFFVHALYGQDVAPIVLKQERVAYAPKSIYISSVTDSLVEANTIGTTVIDGKKQPLKMEGGVTGAFKNYIDHNITEDKAAQAVALNVTKVDFDVKKKGPIWAVNAAMTLTFYAGNMKLMEYSGKGHGEMDSDPGVYCEHFIRQTIEQDISRFDGWWAAHKNEIAVSQEVKVNVTVAKAIDKPDCIVYSTGRLLRIDDFTGREQPEVAELAATYSGMAFGSTGQTETGQLVINVTITPYFDKTKSWFKEAGKNAVLLAHEQAHFDITGIKACELANAIRNTTFTKENYLALFEQLEKKYTDESNDEQEAYDSETNHGTVADKQLEWQTKLAKQVRALGCY